MNKATTHGSTPSTHHPHLPGHEPEKAAGLGWVRYTLMAAFVVALVLAYTLLPLDVWMKAVALELRDLGWVGVPVYGVAFVLWCLFGLPAALFSIAAGVTWGVLWGTLIAVPAATITATTAFLVGRYLFRGKFRDWLMHKPRLTAIDRAVTNRGPVLVLLLRFSPVFPFPILNYVLGLTHIPTGSFFLATLIGMVPITFMWTYVGSVGAELAGLDGAVPGEVGTAKIILGVVGGVATVFVTLWVGRAARRALREAAEAQEAEAAAALTAAGGPQASRSGT